MNLHENYTRLKKEAYEGLQKRESSKNWIRMLEATPYLLGREKGTLLLAVNTGMRILDDIADGDRESPVGTSAVSYLEAKQSFIRNPEIPHDDLDYLFLYCYELADKVGLSIGSELDAFFDYFLFDARRRNTGNIFSTQELDQAYDSCDITGSIRGSLMVFGDDPDKAQLLMPLGKAVRAFYTLRDYDPDIAAGFVNIPREAIEQYEITPEDLPHRFSPSVRAWFHAEAALGLQRINQHNIMMKRQKFRLRGKLVLPIAYIKPAKSCFEAVLADQQ